MNRILQATVIGLLCGSAVSCGNDTHPSELYADQQPSFANGQSYNFWATGAIFKGANADAEWIYHNFFSDNQKTIEFNTGYDLSILLEGPHRNNTHSFPDFQPLEVKMEMTLTGIIPPEDDGRYMFYFANNYTPRGAALRSHPDYSSVAIKSGSQRIEMPVLLSGPGKSRIGHEGTAWSSGAGAYQVPVEVLDTKEANCHSDSTWCSKLISGRIDIANARLTVNWDEALATLKKLGARVPEHKQNILTASENLTHHQAYRHARVCQLLTGVSGLRDEHGRNSLDDIANLPPPTGEIARSRIQEWVRAAEDAGAFHRSPQQSRYEYFRDYEPEIASATDCEAPYMPELANIECNSHLECENNLSLYTVNALRLQWTYSWTETLLRFARRYGRTINTPPWFDDYTRDL